MFSYKLLLPSYIRRSNHETLVLQGEYLKRHPDKNFALLPYFLFMDKTEAGHASKSFFPLQFTAAALERHLVFTRLGTTRIANIPVIGEIPGLSDANKSMLQQWVQQRTMELTLKRLKNWSKV